MKKISEFVFSASLFLFVLFSAILAVKLNSEIWLAVCFLVLALLVIRKIRLSEFKILQKINKKISSERFRKIRILVPIFVATILSLLLYKFTHEIDLILVACFYSIALLLSRHYWKFEKDLEYREKYLKREKEEMALPWHQRRNASQVRINLYGLRICLIVVAIATIFFSIKYLIAGFTAKAVIVFVVFIFCCLSVRSINKILPF